MKTTVDFLNEVKAKYGLKSNYALARKMGQTDTDVARWMHKKNTLSDESALKVSDLLEVDPAHVIACIHAEREKNEKLHALWERIATMTAGLAASVLVILALPYVSLPDGDSAIIAMAGVTSPSTVYYVKSIAAQYWPFAALAAALLLGVPRYNRAPKKEPDKLA